MKTYKSKYINKNTHFLTELYFKPLNKVETFGISSEPVKCFLTEISHEWM